MKLKKVICLATAATMLMGSAAFAEVPKDTMIIGNQAFNIRLMFDPSYKAQILDAMRYANANPDSEGNRPYYYKINQMAQWRTVFGKIPLTEEQIGQWPEITYINADGESTVYQEGNGDPVEDNEDPVAEALANLYTAAFGSADDLITALQDTDLDLNNVAVGDAEAYILDSVDFKYAADPDNGSVEKVQAAVDATNARLAVNIEAAKGVGNEAAVETGVTAFIQAKLDLGNISQATVDAFDTYMAYDSAEKLAVAKIVIGVWNDKNAPYGFYDNADMVYHEHNNGLLSVIEEMDYWIDGIKNALETVDDPLTLEDNEQADAVEAALNNIPASLAVGSTNPNAEADYVYDPYYDLGDVEVGAAVLEFIANAPVEGFTSLAGILDILDAAIETVTTPAP